MLYIYQMTKSEELHRNLRRAIAGLKTTTNRLKKPSRTTLKRLGDDCGVEYNRLLVELDGAFESMDFDLIRLHAEAIEDLCATLCSSKEDINAIVEAISEIQYLEFEERSEAILDDSLQHRDCKHDFESQRSHVLELLGLKSSLKLSPSVEKHFLGMLHVNAVTVLETFLFNRYCQLVLYGDFEQAFLQVSDYGGTKIELKHINAWQTKKEGKIRGNLVLQSWHNVDKRAEQFGKLLGQEIVIPDFEDAIDLRHHLVHRNGRDCADRPVTATIQGIQKFAQKAGDLVESIEAAIIASK